LHPDRPLLFRSGILDNFLTQDSCRVEDRAKSRDRFDRGSLRSGAAGFACLAAGDSLTF
jgi:hypothetical protein